MSKLHLTAPSEIRELIYRNALFVDNHSGGKDSQAQTALLRQIIPASQLLVIHSHLPVVEWDGNVEHIQATIGDLPLIVAEARKLDGSPRTFLNMVEDRLAKRPDISPWPSPQQRQCTSDLKRGPIEREIRRYLKAHPEFNGLIVNCEGLRAGESDDRAKQETFSFNKRNSKAGREWYDWLPIHHLTTLEVFGVIWDALQDPHWVYGEGMNRKSCRHCIYAPEDQQRLAARIDPRVALQIAVRERAWGKTLLMPVKDQQRYLDEFLPTAEDLAPPLPPLASMSEQWLEAA